MTDRQRRIWELLLENPCISAGQIGKMLHISDRTVRSDIKEINHELKDIVIKSVKGRGFYIDQDNIRQLSKETEDDWDQEWELVRRVLFEEIQDYLTVADELYISDAMLSKMLDQVNRTMGLRYGKELIRKNHRRLELNLSEEQKRDYYNTYVTARNVRHYFEPAQYQPFFLWAEPEKLAELIHKELGEGQFYDTTFLRLVISTAVQVERVWAGFVIEEYDMEENVEEEVRQLLDLVAEESKISFPEGEYHYFKKLLKNDFYELSCQDDAYIDKILREILIEVIVEYGFDFTENKEFMDEMKAQINGTMQRTRNNQYAVNPVLPQIKAKYPLEYDIAIFFTDRLSRILQIRVSEDEIGQFAVHLIWGMESSFGRTRQKIALINPFGKQYKDLIEKRIGKIGDCKLELAYEYSVFHYPENVPQDVDAVIATVPLPRPIQNAPVVLCRNFLDYHEQECLLTVLRESQVTNVKKYFKSLFKPALFFTDMEFSTKEQVLGFMCGCLEREGYVDSQFYSSVMDREEIAPTAFEQGFVFAHAMENEARRTAVCSCVLKNRIPWGGYQVKLIFLFALSSSWNHTMLPVYNIMIDHLFMKNTIHRLSKTRELDEFLELLM